MIIVRAGLIGLLFAAALSVANHLAAPVIDENRQAFADRQIAAMVNGREVLATESGYRVFESDELFGHITPTSTQAGYNGRIDLLVAHDLQGEVLAVRVTRHRETPGLGDAIDKTWIDTFKGRQTRVTNWQLAPAGDFDAITGATITSQAVVSAVAEVMQP